MGSKSIKASIQLKGGNHAVIRVVMLKTELIAEIMK